jgi:putative heme-binding domain-containing protein
MELIVAWPGNLKEKVSDFSKLAMSDSLVEPALAALSSLPSNAVAESLGAGEAGKVLKVLLERAGETSPVDRQSDRYAAMLKLGGELTSLSRSQIPNAEKQLKALHASIPTIADPRLMELGAEVYARESHCATCHQANGQGLPNLYPPIDGSLWVTGNQDRLIRLVLDGMHGTIEVKGKRYSSPPLPPMTAFRHLLTDQEIAAVLTYVRNSWSNRAKPVDAKQVAKMRAMDRGKDATFWNVTDLLTAYPMEDGSKPVQQGSADGWVPKFVKEWKFSDFADTDFTNGTRSHQQGMLVFKRMGCVQCHKLGQEGGVFGPNLAELEAKKRTNAVILEAILDPSKEIDEKYAMRTYLTSSGRVVSGFVVKETDESIHVKSDPLNVDESTVVNKDDIEEEKINAKSVMPSGLMNYFSKEEILDLVAYVLAAGDKPLP